MTIETTILDFQLSNTFEQYESHMNAEEQQSMFKEMGVKTFYIGKSIDDPKRATVIFQGPENVLYDIFMNPETKPIVEASGHIYAGTKITRWISRKNKSSNVYLVESNVFDHTFNVLQTRAKPLGIFLKRFTQSNLPNYDDVFGMLLQLPGKNGQLYDPTFLISQAHRSEIIVTACIDPLAQVLI